MGDSVFDQIVLRVAPASNQYPPLSTDLQWWFDTNYPIRDFDCLRAVYTCYDTHCLKGFEDYSLKYVRVFSNLCSVENEELKDLIIKHTMKVCKDPAFAKAED